MIDPRTSAWMFCTQVNDRKKDEYIVVHTLSGLTGKTYTQKLASRLSEITDFVSSILKQKSHLKPTDFKDLKQSFSTIVTQQTPWYHKILAFFSTSFRQQQIKTQAVLTELTDALKLAETTQKLHATQKIYQHIKIHLEPYLSGKITKETDNKNRPPLIKGLEDMIQTEFPLANLDSAEIEKIAFDEYLRQALQGYTNTIDRPMHPEAPEWNKHKQEFIFAFTDAIKIDFTPKFIQSQKLSELLLNALWAEYRRANI